MIKIYQKQWFEIPFNTFCTPSAKQLAGSDFYASFYNQFYKRYDYFDNLPERYQYNKNKIADFLADFILKQSAKNILSFGCGVGIVEERLVTLVPDIALTVYEPDNNFRWLQNNKRIQTCYGSFAKSLVNSKFDLIYLNCVDYALSNEEYVRLLMQFKSLEPQYILLTDLIKPYPSMLSFFKYWLKRLLANLGIYNPGQFWGYLRHYHEHNFIIKKSGYEVISTGQLTKDSIWIEIRPILS